LGQAVDNPGQLPNILSVSPVFRGNCPLWTYILAEARHHAVKVDIPTTEQVKVTTPRLGPVGGRIVAEVFLGLMFGDNTSVISMNPNWHPGSGPHFTLRDLVRVALGKA